MSSGSAAIVAWGACSPFGVGEDAALPPRPSERAQTRVVLDPELAAAGLARPFCARVPIETVDEAERDRATVLLDHALARCADDLDRVMPRWREVRVGLAIGTSSGGMRTFGRAYGQAPLPLEGTYLGPVLASRRPCSFEPFSLVLGACASSALAIGLARSWILEGACDVALCGGFDAVSVFVASGFEVLRATSATPGPRPFRTARDGLALGEGAVLLALARAERARAFVTGFGASCDAVHLTAPDRTGGGLARAARAALDEASASAVIDLVSAHGTATVFNDAAERAAIRETLGERADAVAVHALKGSVGHTLGAAGALETLTCVRAIEAAVAPATYGDGPVDDGVRILDEGERRRIHSVLKLASAFGGSNAALVVSRDRGDGVAAPGARVHVSRAVHVDGATLPDAAALAAKTGYPEDRIARGDGLVRLVLAAVAELEARVGSVRGAGIVVGLGLATLETNARYLERYRVAGPARAEPRRFPYTTPNASAGEAAIAFGLTGPAFAVGGGPHGGIEALSVGASLVARGVAERVVVVAADEAAEASARVAPGTRSGAVALLVGRGLLEGRLESARVRLDPRPMPHAATATAPMHAHAALLPLTARHRPDHPVDLEAALPWGGIANARIFWL